MEKIIRTALRNRAAAACQNQISMIGACSLKGNFLYDPNDAELRCRQAAVGNQFAGGRAGRDESESPRCCSRRGGAGEKGLVCVVRSSINYAHSVVHIRRKKIASFVSHADEAAPISTVSFTLLSKRRSTTMTTQRRCGTGYGAWRRTWNGRGTRGRRRRMRRITPATRLLPFGVRSVLAMHSAHLMHLSYIPQAKVLV